MSDRSEVIIDRIKDGFIATLSQKPYNKIKVTDITATSGISRNTFYRYFKDKDEVLFELIDSYLDDYFSSVNELLVPLTEEGVTQIFKTGYVLAKNNQNIIKLIFAPEVYELCYQKFRSFAKRICGNICRTRDVKITDPIHFEYIVDLYAGGLFHLCKRWVDDGMTYDIDKVAKLNTHLLNERFVDLLKTASR